MGNVSNLKIARWNASLLMNVLLMEMFAVKDIVFHLKNVHAKQCLIVQTSNTGVVKDNVFLLSIIVYMGLGAAMGNVSHEKSVMISFQNRSDCNGQTIE